jgi:hypothetical protein
MVPSITRRAEIHFRQLDPETRDDLVQEVVANCLVAFERLSSIGKAHQAYASALARYAIRQVKLGRRVGSRLKARDASSQYALQRSGRVVERLDVWDAATACWKEIVVEDRRASPAETAACRIDFQAWLRLLPIRERRLAKLLATGEKVSVAAQRFSLTSGRVSQMRRQLETSWEAFQAQANLQP